MIKYLFQDNADILYYMGDTWSIAGTAPVTKDMFLTYGSDDLTLFNRSVKTFTMAMTDNGTLGNGKTYRKTVDLTKFIELESLNITTK